MHCMWWMFPQGRWAFLPFAHYSRKLTNQHSSASHFILYSLPLSAFVDPHPHVVNAFTMKVISWERKETPYTECLILPNPFSLPLFIFPSPLCLLLAVSHIKPPHKVISSFTSFLSFSLYSFAVDPHSHKHTPRQGPGELRVEFLLVILSFCPETGV